MGKIRRTAAARLDYLQIFLYVGERNLAAAEKLIRRFDEALELILKHPGAGPERPDLGRGLRTYPVGKYLLIYRATNQGIDLLRAVHGARNLRKLFKRR
jgi:toxin ParE1/3/4